MKKQLLVLTLLASVVTPAIANDACCGNPAEAIIPAAQEPVVAPETVVAPEQSETQPVEAQAATEDAAVQTPPTGLNPEEEEMTEEEIQKMIQKLLAEQGIQPEEVASEVAPEAQS